MKKTKVGKSLRSNSGKFLGTEGQELQSEEAHSLVQSLPPRPSGRVCDISIGRKSEDSKTLGKINKIRKKGQESERHWTSRQQRGM